MNNEELKEKIKNLIHDINVMLKIPYEENINLTDFNERMEEITGIYIFKERIRKIEGGYENILLISINPLLLDLPILSDNEIEKMYKDLIFYYSELLELINFYFDYIKEGEI